MSIKVSLENNAAESIKEMVGQLKIEHPDISISPSDLTTWIVMNFKSAQFEKQKIAIANAHFNPKAYLRQKLKIAQSREEIANVMIELHQRIQPLRKRKPRSSKGNLSLNKSS